MTQRADGRRNGRHAAQLPHPGGDSGIEGHGTIGIRINPMGGAVFNARTQNWVDGLVSDPVVQTATRNVLNRLGPGHAKVYDAVSSPILTRGVLHCRRDEDGPRLPARSWRALLRQ